MPLVFHSALRGSQVRSILHLKVGEIQMFRQGMTNLEDCIMGSNLPFKESFSLSGTFPKNEVLSMIAQNPDCSHISFMTGRIDGCEKESSKNYTFLVPMTKVVEGQEHSGEIIDNEGTIYIAICCQHPPFIAVANP
jgi:hypothetical protein